MNTTLWVCVMQGTISDFLKFSIAPCARTEWHHICAVHQDWESHGLKIVVGEVLYEYDYEPQQMGLC